MNNVHIKRTELYNTKGNVTIPLPERGNPPTMYELNDSFGGIFRLRNNQRAPRSGTDR